MEARINYVMQSKKYRAVKHLAWILIRSVFLIGFSFVILYPVISMVSKAFMQQIDLYDNSVLWIPKHFTLENLQFAWWKMNFPVAFFKSFLFTSLGTVMQAAVCLMAGYSFARFQFKLKGIFFVFVILSILIPPQQILTPLYLHMVNFDFFGILTAVTGSGINLTATYIPFFLVSLTGFGLRNGLFIFLFRQSFRGIPKETEEAALVDGAGRYAFFCRSCCPALFPILVTVLLFSFVWQWNDTYYSSVLLPTERMLPQAFELFNSYIKSHSDTSVIGGSFLQNYNMSDYKVWALLRNAGVLLVMFPLMIIYIVAQRYFVESIDRSGLVG